MGGICQSPSGKWFVWTFLVEKSTSQSFLTEDNPSTINDLELADYVSHIHSFAPIMAPLDNISTKVKITVEKYGPDVAVSDQ